MFLTLVAAVVVAADQATTERHHIYHHPHARTLKSPLEFNQDLEKQPAPAADKTERSSHTNSLEELFQEQSAIQTAAGLSASGPLTREDFGGEKPYEVESVVEDTPSNQEDEQMKVQYRELESPTDASPAVDSHVITNLQTSSTVPKMLSDGRLVRVPVENAAPAASQGSDVKLDESIKPQLASPEITVEDLPDTANLAPDLNLLQTEAGLGTGEEAQLKASARSHAANAPFAAKKVRVSSLVGGILSSVLSSVLTRGMEFTTAKTS